MNPVTQALFKAAADEEERRAIAISISVARRIGPPEEREAGLPADFTAWCQREGIQSMPAWPAAVALYVLEHEGLGIDRLAETVRDISIAHLSHGRADPCSGYPVATALNKLANVAPPRSWAASEKHRFVALPYDLQRYFAKHEDRREKEIRRAQNEAADARKALAAIQKPTETTDGNQSHAAA